MKRSLLTLGVSAVVAVLLSGCFSPSRSVVTEYDPATGKITKTTEVSESVVKNLTDSTKNKIVYMYDNSFLAYLSATAATSDTPTPAVKMGVGKADKGLLTAPAGTDVSALVKVVEAGRASEIKLTATGIGSNSGAGKKDETVQTEK